MHVHFVISMVNAALSLQSIEGEMEETKKKHRTDLWRLSAMCPARQSSTIFGDCSIWIYCSESSKIQQPKIKPFWDSLRYRPSVSWVESSNVFNLQSQPSVGSSGPCGQEPNFQGGPVLSAALKNFQLKQWGFTW